MNKRWSTPTHIGRPKEQQQQNDYVISSSMPPTTTATSKAMQRLVQECFAASVRSHYEPNCPLPVLKSTNLKILKAKSNGTKKTLSTSDAAKDEPKETNEPVVRSRSADLSTTRKNDERIEDLQLVQACFYVITSFMRDHHEPLTKGQNTHLFETTVAERRKNFINKKRLWKRSSSSGSTEDGGDKTPSPLQTKRGRPRSAYVTGDSGYDSDRSASLNMAGIDCDVIEKMSVLEKVQFVATVGLSLVQLRDEIYCQILKQIHGNPSLRSAALGWILLSLLAGCFPPSNKILPLIQDVLTEQDSGGSNYCTQRLLNIKLKGERTNPPCSLELQAAKLRQDIRLPIICMDHSVRTVWVDSMTTVKDICHKVASKNRLGDAFGFSIFFSLDNKVVPLGGGDFYIMDAISQAERYANLNAVRDSWRIYFRREFFSPHDAAGLHDNYMKSWLTYSQICGGVQSGEYECIKSQDLALLIAHQFCVKNGGLKKDIDEDKCSSLCLHALPAKIPKEDRKKWVRMVVSTLEALQEKEGERGKLKEIDVMEQIVRYASRAFIASFTKTFILSSFIVEDDSEQLKTPRSMKINHLRIAIGSDPSSSEEEEKMIQLQRIKSVESSSKADQFRITLFGGRSCLGTSSQSEEIVTILQRFIHEIQSGKNNESVA